jgi:hypothetical protein
VMQSADMLERCHVTLVRRLNGSSIRSVLR